MTDRNTQIEEMTARLKIRAILMCQAALGKQKAMRLDKNNSVSGTIVKAEFHQVRVRQGSVVVQFKIVLESGPQKVQREFICEQLPR